MILPRILRTVISWFTKPEPVNREHRLSELAARRARLRRSRKRVAEIDREAVGITTRMLRQELRV